MVPLRGRATAETPNWLQSSRLFSDQQPECWFRQNRTHFWGTGVSQQGGENLRKESVLLEGNWKCCFKVKDICCVSPLMMLFNQTERTPAVRTRPCLPPQTHFLNWSSLTAGADAESSCWINNIMKRGVGARKRGRKCWWVKKKIKNPSQYPRWHQTDEGNRCQPVSLRLELEPQNRSKREEILDGWMDGWEKQVDLNKKD